MPIPRIGSSRSMRGPNPNLGSLRANPDGRPGGRKSYPPPSTVGRHTGRCCREGGMSLGIINIADLCNLTHFRSPSVTAAAIRSIFLLRVFRIFHNRARPAATTPGAHCLLFLRLPLRITMSNAGEVTVDVVCSILIYAAQYLCYFTRNQWFSRKKEQLQFLQSLIS